MPDAEQNVRPTYLFAYKERANGFTTTAFIEEEDVKSLRTSEPSYAFMFGCSRT